MTHILHKLHQGSAILPESLTQKIALHITTLLLLLLLKAYLVVDREIFQYPKNVIFLRQALGYNMQCFNNRSPVETICQDDILF